jgi:hypothetical protein
MSRDPRVECVLDTNIYRGFSLEAGEAALAAGNWQPLLSPLNALEILGVRDESDEGFARDFGARRSAARKMLAWCSSGDELRMVPDPEAFQASLLGCSLQAYDYSPWRQALERLAEADGYGDLQDGPRYINVAHARELRGQAYKQFCEKVEKVKSAYNEAFAELNAPETIKANDPVTIMMLLVRDGVLEGIIDTEYERVSSIVEELQRDDDPSIAGCIEGSPIVLLRYSLFRYAEFYMAYLRFVLETRRNPDKNDFGDLQFGIYAAGGIPLITNEKQWHLVAARARASNSLFSLVKEP